MSEINSILHWMPNRMVIPIDRPTMTDEERQLIDEWLSTPGNDPRRAEREWRQSIIDSMASDIRVVLSASLEQQMDDLPKRRDRRMEIMEKWASMPHGWENFKSLAEEYNLRTTKIRKILKDCGVPESEIPSGMRRKKK